MPVATDPTNGATWAIGDIVITLTLPALVGHIGVRPVGGDRHRLLRAVDDGDGGGDGVGGRADHAHRARAAVAT